MGLALQRDKTLSVAVPEIGQNLHELDWQFLPFRFSIYSVEALSKRFTQTIIQLLRAVCLVSLWGPHFGKSFITHVGHSLARGGLSEIIHLCLHVERHRRFVALKALTVEQVDIL